MGLQNCLGHAILHEREQSRPPAGGKVAERTTDRGGRVTGLANRLRQVRLRLGLTQGELAARCGSTQSDLSRLEAGKRSPSLAEAVALARVLDLPLQWFLTGQVRCGTELGDLAAELRSLGAVDLLVPETRVPGAFRPPEEILAYVIRGERPDPRVTEALPAVLAWN